MKQPCFLRLGGDYLEDATYCPSIAYALGEYEACAHELDGYGQAIEASVHFVNSRDDEPDEYPDRVLSLGIRGGLVVGLT